MLASAWFAHDELWDLQQSVVFDGRNRIIIEVDVGVSNTISVGQLYSEWKEWTKIDDHAKYATAFSVVGGDPITDTQSLGSTFFLENGWRIRPAELNHKLVIQGNLYTREPGESVFIPTLGSFTVNTETSVSSLVDSSVSRLDLTQLLQSVYIDTVNGVPGTAEGVGTPTNPVSNVEDARVIADRENLRRFNFSGVLSINQSYEGWDFIGDAAEEFNSVIINNVSVNRSRFNGCNIEGSALGKVEVVDGSIRLLSGLDGTFRRCGLRASFTIAPNASCFFDSCYSEVPGSGSPSCTLETNSNISVRNYSGGLRIVNSDATNTSSIDLDPGKLVVDSSCTGGQILVRGTGSLVNESAIKVNDEGLLNNLQLRTDQYTGGVNLDSNGVAGTEFPIGTPTTPVNNLDDALTIASSLGFKSLIINDGVFAATGVHNLDGFFIRGTPSGEPTLVLSGASTNNIGLDNLIVIGSIGRLARIDNCLLGSPGQTVSLVSGAARESIILGESILVNNVGESLGFVFKHCTFNGSSGSYPILSLTNTLSGFAVEACTGTLEVQDMDTPTSTIQDINLVSGKIVISASNTSGALSIRGAGEIEDNSNGAVVVHKDGYINTEQLRLGLENFTRGSILGTVTPTQTEMATDLSETLPNHWVDAFVRFTSGNLAGQIKLITAYNGVNKVLTTEAFSSAPSIGDTFTLINA